MGPRSFKPGGGGGGGFRSKSKNDNDKKGDNEKGPKIGYLSEEMMAYYRQVSATLEAGFDDEDSSDKRGFLDNVFNALKDEGVQVSQNQTVSRILEFLLSHSEPAHCRILFGEFCKNLTTVSFDRFASHVFQSLIQYLPSMYDDVDADESERTALKTSIEKLCQFSQSHVKQLMPDTYGSHVLRAVLEILGGVHVKEDVIRSHVSRNQHVASTSAMSEQLSSDYKSDFNAIKTKVLALCNYADHLTDANCCPVLQTVLLILHKSDKKGYKTVVKTIMEKVRPPTEEAPVEDVAKHLSTVVQDTVGSYLVELLVSLTSEKKVPKLYENVFKGKLIYYAVHPVANYVLQKFFSCITNNELLEEIVTEASHFLEDILAVNHVGVITKLAQACRKNQTQQDQFTQALMKAFHCHEPEVRQLKIMPLIAVMQTYEMFFPGSDEKSDAEKSTDMPSSGLLKSVNIHGSLVLQEMVQFSRPKRLIGSLLSLSPAELSNLASDKCGSHVVEAFFKSPTVWDRSKEDFLKKIKGLFVSVACSKNGSRCLEGIWDGCSVKMKALIADELTKSGERLESDKFGHFLHRNFALAKFSSRKREWLDLQSGTKKKQQLLQSILEGKLMNKRNKKRKVPCDDNVKENKKVDEDNARVVPTQEDDSCCDNNSTGEGAKKKRKMTVEGETDSVQEKTKTKKKKRRKKNKKKLKGEQ